VLARDRLGTGALAPPDRVDESVVLVLGHEQDLPGLGHRRVVDHQQCVRRAERQRQYVVERAVELGALRQSPELVVELLVEAEVLHERLHARAVDDGIELATDIAERIEVAVGVQALGREPCGGAFEHAPQLDRVVDVRASELADDEPTAGHCLEEPFVLEGHECDAQRRSRDAQLLDEAKLRHALARLERAAQQELAQPERRLRRLGVLLVPAWHRATRWRAAGRGARARRRGAAAPGT
jgi:hypothetical protein